MLTAADIMTTDVITVMPNTLVHDIAKLLYARRISGVPVVDTDSHVLGVVSEGDLIGHVDALGEQRVDNPRRSWWLTLFGDETNLARNYAKAHGRTAQDVMTPNVISVSEMTSVSEIASILERNRIKRVPVVRNGKLVGIVTRANLLQALTTRDVSKSVSLSDQAIREQFLAVLDAQPWTHPRMKNVVVQNGIIQLWGSITSEDERRALRAAAESVPGARAVEDHLAEFDAEREHWEALRGSE
jgi:CBS-domain-containing membrane protein